MSHGRSSPFRQSHNSRIGQDGNKVSKRFPKGGIVGYPAELTDISKVTHRRHTQGQKKSKQAPFASTKIDTMELQQGLQRMGLELSKVQVERLRNMSGDSVLSSILDISKRPVASSSSTPDAQQDCVVPRHDGKKLYTSKNESKQISPLLRNDGSSEEAGRKLRVAIPMDSHDPHAVRKLSKNNSDPVKTLLAVDGPVPSLALDSQTIENLLTPKSTRRLPNAMTNSRNFAGQETVELLLDAESVSDKKTNATRSANNLKLQPPQRENRVLHNFRRHVLERFGKDLSSLHDAFERADTDGSGCVSSNRLRSILKSSCGLSLSDKDFSVLLSSLPDSNQSQVSYSSLLANLKHTARKTLPDQTINPVNSAHRRKLQLQRLVGEPLLVKMGSSARAFERLQGENGKMDTTVLLQKLEKEVGLQLSTQDKAQIELEFRKAHAEKDMSFEVFRSVLFGAPTQQHQAALWEDETKLDEELRTEQVAFMREKRKRCADLEARRLLLRIQSCLEKKRAWGASMRDTFLLLDKDRSGKLGREELVKGLENMGVPLTSREADVLTQALCGKEEGKGCTYHDFATALTAANGQPNDQPVLVHHFKQRRHVQTEQETSAPGRAEEVVGSIKGAIKPCIAMDLLCNRQKTLHEVFLHLKQYRPLSAEMLRRRLQETTGMSISEREMKAFLKQGSVRQDSKDISFVEFERLASHESRLHATSYELELARKTPRASDRASVTSSSSNTNRVQDPRFLCGGRVRDLMCHQPSTVLRKQTIQQPTQPIRHEEQAKTGKVLRLKMGPPPPPVPSLNPKNQE